MDNEELIRLFAKVSRENCKKSFDKIFNYYYPKLVDFANLYLESREMAEEVASDVLFKIFMKRNKLLFIKKPEAYLYKSVKNQSLSYLRKTKKYNQFTVLNDEPINYAIDAEASPENKFIEKEFFIAISEIIERMPSRRKLIFKFVKQDGKSYKEVAELLQISVKTVEVHMGLAIADIRKSIEKYDRQNNLNYLRIVKSILIPVGILINFTT